MLDIHLGGMSGLELRRRLLDAGATIPVVFITAFDDEATRREADALGYVDYLQKPFEASRLIGALERGWEVRERQNDLHGGPERGRQLRSTARTLAPHDVSNLINERSLTCVRNS